MSPVSTTNSLSSPIRDPATCSQHPEKTKKKLRYAFAVSASALSIKVETLQGVAQLSGFAKSQDERLMAERLARDTLGVVLVRTGIVVSS